MRNLLNHLLYDSLLRNHLGYVHDLLHLLRNKDVNIIFVLHDGDDGDWRLHDGDMMVTMVIGDHGDEQAQERLQFVRHSIAGLFFEE